ncbi:response regulator [Paenibacillus lignilyticus]|uniref:Response regulator n=1 Tax=Paenibacillus lignilyticus TaxID=1172615 RepID=A0ABS5CI28_9BACL|nr:response regulator [Paenibacillus lignilyticus]MBP3965519.1 response regulator [Paenibacillus lignilyticus]
MLNIAIVDDEEIIRLGLEKMITRFSSDYRIVGSYEDGAEALAAIGAPDLQVDLIITDIKMPYMDGLRFIELVKEKLPGIRCLILSGYNDFEYARKAIQFGVDDYMIKPVDLQELSKLLQTVDRQLSERRENEEQLALAARQQRGHELEEQLRKLLQSGGAGEHAAPSLLPELQSGRGAVIVFRTSNMLAHESLLHYLDEIKAMFHHVVVMDNNLIAVLLSVQEDGKQPEKSVRAISLRLMDYMHNRSGGFIAIGESVLPHVGGSWHGAYVEGLAASRHQFYKERETFAMNLKDLPAKAEQWKFNMPALDEQFKTACEMLDSQTIKTVIPLFFAEAERGKAGYDEIMHMAGHLFYTLTTKIDGFLDALYELQGATFDFHRTVASHFAMRDLKEWLIAIVDQVVKALEPTRNASSKRVIETVKLWIQEHYREEIELTALSETVFLNASYLSFLFKRETNQTITEYITSVRMAKAKEYLKDRLDLKAYQIGELVGYADGIYFNKLFKKTVGVTPQKYRNQTSGSQ